MIPKKHRALSHGALAPGARFPTSKEQRGQKVRRLLDAYLERVPGGFTWVTPTLVRLNKRAT